jgi:hypothetical protein
MNTETLLKEVEEFNKQTHGSTNYHEDIYYIKRPDVNEYAPLGYMLKKTDITGLNDVLRHGFVCESLELIEREEFHNWFEHQFSRKLKRAQARQILIVSVPENSKILDAIETVFRGYEIFKNNAVILNGKNLPTQLGEWYAKCIFGLRQTKSTSQRGFDFYSGENRVEVKVHWSDTSSPKGVKLRKSLVELSDFVIVIYIANNFMIREVCLLDSDFVIRKFSSKGHTIFLKDNDISDYFFSKSDKHLDKVVNSNALLKFATPSLALKLSGSFSK